jgi:nucleotide-binding universal stress UspA family protein
MYSKILVPIDGSDTAARGLSEAISLARLTRGRLRLMHVVDELSFTQGAALAGAYVSDVLQSLSDAGADLLAKARDQVQAAGLEADTVLTDNFQGRVCDLVTAEAARWGAELIVLGTHGRRGAERLVLGSDAEQIVRTSPVPVLLVRHHPTPATH